MAFRLRIALLSLAISGVLLVGFGIFFLTTIQSVGLERVDREIRAVAASQLRSRQPPGRWRNVERSLRFVYGDESSARLAIQVRDARREILFTSPSFPSEIGSLTPPELPFRSRPTDRADTGSDAVNEGRNPGDRPSRVEGFVARLDADADGRVSIEEFDGPPGDFAELDADGDGYMTRTEATVAERLRPPRPREAVFRTVKTSTGEWRIGFLGNEYIYLTIGVNLADLSQEASRFRQAFLLGTMLALLVLAAAGWWLAGRALRPVALLTRTAERVTAGGLDQRVPEVAADRELRRLVEVINSMLERLERSFAQAERFSSDAAHELQTPLTVLQ
ncbi:MAG: HAMP domain-containing protein, partial [Myxococcales bacterium]|nr:HAMP domain-containing protein [Deltaproteobacteria bacterium]NNL24276.1 HAMP domain-containing protein [Myxococcales bacterium]